MASRHGWKVELIPWDHLNSEHVERMYEQRVACGWRSDEVLSYVEFAKKGGRIFYWVVLSDAVPDRENLLQTHVKAYPKEATALEDTAREVRLMPREPTGARFTPIGHIALEIHTPEEDEKFDLPGEGVVWVHQLYISYALQKGGFGMAAMAQVEMLAVRQPMNAKILALDTMSEKDQMSPLGLKLMYQDRGLPTPLVSTQDWYARQGFRIHKYLPKAFVSKPRPGTTYEIDCVCMSKLVG